MAREVMEIGKACGVKDLDRKVMTKEEIDKRLEAADLSTDNKDLAQGSDLSSRVRHAPLGECHAFMSHSWRE